MATLVRMSDGATLWTVSTGPRDAPGMVFLHGGPGLWDYLEPLADLASGVRRHRYDQRGCGRSGPSDDHRMARYVADLDELRLQFGYDRWYVVGHSFGASLALRYAATHPHRVAGLVLCSGVGLGWRAHRAEYGRRAAARLTPQERARRDELGARAGRTWAEEVEWRTLMWMPDFADRGAAPRLAAAVARTPLPINTSCNDALNAENLYRSPSEERAECARVTAPVEVVHGAEDPRPGDGVVELAAALPQARLTVLPGAGHHPWQERPAELAELLAEVVPAG